MCRVLDIRDCNYNSLERDAFGLSPRAKFFLSLIFYKALHSLKRDSYREIYVMWLYAIRLYASKRSSFKCNFVTGKKGSEGMEQLYEHNIILDTAFKILEHDLLSREMRAYAQKQNIPIIEDSGLETVLQFLKLKKPQRILEIGSAIGYWSIMISRHTRADVVTIERDPQNYKKAYEYIARSTVANKITIYQADALEFDVSQLESQIFDVIFIDAAKSAYQRFFEKYETFLASDGLIISDNLLFHGHIFIDKEELSNNLRDLTRKIKNYSAWLAEHPNYETIFLPLGDGIAFSYRLASNL